MVPTVMLSADVWKTASARCYGFFFFWLYSHLLKKYVRCPLDGEGCCLYPIGYPQLEKV